jgi:phosphate:Na+ symporter
MYEMAAQTVGGLALFLLAMRMMTNGLRLFGGEALRRTLGGWTRTPLRGVATGATVTGLVQSSSAVTVATIGFVNAGVLSLGQALGVVYGANVGTTVTSWLVSAVGVGVKVENAALPILALGTVLLLVSPRQRGRGLGEALAGFGLFFLGLALLRDGLSGLTVGLEPATLGLPDVWTVPAFLGIGFAATVVMQSSSATIALILTSAAAGAIGLEAAAAAVVGAGLGTTSTAAFAVIGATPNARRVALGHIAFNVVAGAVALLLLPLMLRLVAGIEHLLRLADVPTVTLAVFHTLYKLVGLALILPLTGRLTLWLSHRFRTAAEDAARPRFLDASLVATPSLAVIVLRREMRRMREQTRAVVRYALTMSGPATARLNEQADAIQALGEVIAGFASRLREASLAESVAAELPLALRTQRYLAEAARLAPRVAGLATGARSLSSSQAAELADALDAAERALAAGRADPAVDHPEADRLAVFEDAYQAAKTALLEAGVERRLPVPELDRLLSALSATRRMVEQFVKAGRYLDLGEDPGALTDEPYPTETAGG